MGGAVRGSRDRQRAVLGRDGPVRDSDRRVTDTLGRRLSFLFSIATLCITAVLYLVAAQAEAGLFVFGLVSIFMGLGFTFYSGALEAWLVDALNTVGGDQQLDHVFAR